LVSGVEKVRLPIAEKCSVTTYIRFVKFSSDNSIGLLDCEANTALFFMFVDNYLYAILIESTISHSLGYIHRVLVKCGIAECGMRKVKCGIENAERR